MGGGCAVDGGCTTLWARVAVIFAGGFLGTAARVGILDAVGNQPVALAVVNLLGCLLIGIVAGIYGQRVTLLRLFLAVGGIAAFTSWSSLALQGVASPAMVAFVAAEATIGVLVAGLGHLWGWKRWRRDAVVLAP